jgi:hypothetical protein
MIDKPLDQLSRLNDWLAEHEPDLYHTDADTATTIIGLLERLRDELAFDAHMAPLDTAEIFALRQDNARLRAALGMITGVANEAGDYYCPWCKRYLTGTLALGHRPDCERQLALGVQP